MDRKDFILRQNLWTYIVGICALRVVSAYINLSYCAIHERFDQNYSR